MRSLARHRPLIIGIAALVAITAGCSSDPTNVDEAQVAVTVPDEQLRTVYSTWINQLGLVRDDPDIWRVRLSEACTLGVWDTGVAERLAERYVVEDESVSARAPDTGPPSIEEAANALWLMALQVCGDEFPVDEIDGGPPFTPDGS